MSTNISNLGHVGRRQVHAGEVTGPYKAGAWEYVVNKEPCGGAGDKQYTITHTLGSWAYMPKYRPAALPLAADRHGKVQSRTICMAAEQVARRDEV